MARRLRIGYPSPGNSYVAAEYGSYTVTGRDATLSTDAVPSATFNNRTPTHYVAPFASVSGAASDTATQDSTAFNNASNPASPCTLGCAMANATAGDIIGVTTGVYSGIADGDRWHAVFRPANSGASGNPIIIVAEYPAVLYPDDPELWSEIRTNSVWNSPGTNSPAIGTDGENYIYIEGFFGDYNQAYPAPTGGVICCANSTGSELRLNRVDATGGHYSNSGHNANHIFSENCIGVTFENNYLLGNVVEGSGGIVGHNNAQIETYGLRDSYIQNNLHDCPQGGHSIYVKGTASGGIPHENINVRYNRCNNGTLSIGCTIEGYVYQNLVVGQMGYGAIVFEGSGAQVGGIRVYNNTIYNRKVDGNPDQILGIMQEGTGTSVGGNQIYNNIVSMPSGNNECVNGGDMQVGDINDWDKQDYNFYYGDGDTVRFSLPGAQHTGLTAYRAALQTAGQGVGARETNSVQASTSPFVNIAAGDFHITGGHAALTAGEGGTPVGAYITGDELIGLSV